MREQHETPRGQKIRGRTVAIILAAIAVLLILLFVIRSLGSPTPSVTAYCSTYKQEKARLSSLSGDTWSSAVFDDSLNDASQYADSFGKLRKVAPKEIEPDVATLQSVYQKIHDDPSSALSASMSGTGAEDSVKNWTKNHCPN